jgi:hypothetical protein
MAKADGRGWRRDKDVRRVFEVEARRLWLVAE